MSISWKPWASLGAPSPADAHHQVTAAGGSSIIEFAAAAPRRPKTCPNATRKACAFRSHSPANFEFPRPCRRPRKGAHHEHQRDPRDAAEEGRRQSRVFHEGFAFTVSPSPGGPRPHPQKGPAALPDCTTRNAADPASSDPHFSIGPRGTSPGGFSERARVSQPFPRRGRPQGGQPASIIEHSGARNRPCGARRGPQRGRIISISGVRQRAGAC